MERIMSIVESKQWLRQVFRFSPAISWALFLLGGALFPLVSPSVFGDGLMGGFFFGVPERPSRFFVILNLVVLLPLIQVAPFLLSNPKVQERKNLFGILSYANLVASALFLVTASIFAVYMVDFVTSVYILLMLGFFIFSGVLRLHETLQSFEAPEIELKRVAPKSEKRIKSGASPAIARFATPVLAGLFLVSMLFPWYGSSASASGTGWEGASASMSINGFMSTWPVPALLLLVVVAVLALMSKAAVVRIVMSAVAVVLALSPAFINSSYSSSSSIEVEGFSASASASASSGALWGLWVGVGIAALILALSIFAAVSGRKSPASATQGTTD